MNTIQLTPEIEGYVIVSEPDCKVVQSLIERPVIF